MPSAKAVAGASAGGPVALGGSRYAVYGAIAAGGMATIEYGRLIGPHGFSRDVVIKRLHPHLAKDAELVAMLVDEARLSSRVRHANVVAMLDVIEAQGEIALVMEYVHGVSFAGLIDRACDRGERIPVAIAATVTAGALHGLHAAHEAVDPQGEPLRIVHRDVSPYNLLIGSDGVTRVIDFGIAKAKGRLRTTSDGQIKGTLAYIAPEQLRGGETDRRTDVYGASVVLWEALAGRRLFDADNESALLYAVMQAEVAPPSSVNPSVPEALDRIVMRGLSRVPDERFASARDMARAIEHAIASVPCSAIAAWLHELAGDELTERAQLLQRLQTSAEIVDSRAAHVPAVEAGTNEIADTQVDRSGRAARTRGVAIVAVCILAMIGVTWALGWGGRNPGTSSTPPPTQHPPPAPSPNPTPSVKPTPSVNHSDPIPDPIPSPSPNSRSPKPAHKPRPATPPEALPPEARQLNCVPPYVIDRQGVRHPKPECL